jgi:hypothetical protein
VRRTPNDGREEKSERRTFYLVRRVSLTQTRNFHRSRDAALCSV